VLRGLPTRRPRSGDGVGNGQEAPPFVGGARGTNGSEAVESEAGVAFYRCCGRAVRRRFRVKPHNFKARTCAGAAHFVHMRHVEERSDGRKNGRNSGSDAIVVLQPCAV